MCVCVFELVGGWVGVCVHIVFINVSLLCVRLFIQCPDIFRALSPPSPLPLRRSGLKSFATLLAACSLLGCYGGFLSGVSMFNESCSVVQSAFHFVGCVSVSLPSPPSLSTNKSNAQTNVWTVSLSQFSFRLCAANSCQIFQTVPYA